MITLIASVAIVLMGNLLCSQSVEDCKVSVMIGGALIGIGVLFTGITIADLAGVL